MFVSVFAVILLAGMASAAGLNFVDVEYSSTGDHNSDLEVKFKLQNEISNGYDISNIILDFDLVADGTWSLPSTSGLDLASGEESSLLTATLTIPENKNAGDYSGELGGTCEYSSSTGSSRTINDHTIDISINPAPSLTISNGEDALTEADKDTTITITNDGNVDLTGIELIASTEDFDVTFNLNDFDLAAGATKDVTVTLNEDYDEIFGGSVSITAEESTNNLSDTGSVNYQGDFCEEVANLEDLGITIEEINIKEGFGEDDEYVYPFDEVEVEITIEPGRYDIQKIEVEWELYTLDGEKIADDTESKFNLDEDDSDKEMIIRFKLDESLNDLEGQDKLRLFVRAKGKVDDSDSSNDNEDTCVSAYEDIDVITDDTFMVLDNIEFSADSVSCGTDLTITAELWNIGDEKQEDITVLIYNSELGISKEVEFDDVSAFDSEDLNAVITIPENAVGKIYELQFRIYDEDNDIYETSEEEDTAIFKELLTVSGSCALSSTPTISASLESDAQAGKSLVVKTTIVNPGTELATYIIKAAGYADWAESAEFDSSTVVLEAGATKELELTFEVKKDAAGDETFEIEVYSGTDLVLKQPVSITITKASGFFARITGNVVGGNSWYLWAIGALNVVLVLVIIIVALRIAKS